LPSPQRPSRQREASAWPQPQAPVRARVHERGRRTGVLAAQTGGLKTAGALGLLAGLWLQPIGIAAGIGLVLFFVGAVITHIRADVIYNIGFPAAHLGLSIASLALAITR
jgi:hypothetical protein